jgi:histidinol dehydrogenase
MSDALFAIDSSIARLTPDERSSMLQRGLAVDPSIPGRVAALIARVRRGGDAALRELARELDGVEIEALEVPQSEWQRAVDSLDLTLIRALERARDNIARAHEAWRPLPVEIETEPGVLVGRRPDPLARVGVYAPGGRAAYPSSVLMGLVPARVAGVGEIILCSPPQRTGLPATTVLAAAHLAGADRVFAIGGSGAVAAMAYGTDTVPRVDRIVGPGNAWVAEAKVQVASSVGIDSPAGPSELLVIWDGTASVAAVAREIVAQAEHDPDAAVVVLLLPRASREDVLSELERQLADAPRAPVARQALASRGALLLARDAAEAVEFADAWAPEHLLLAVDGPDGLLPSIRNAGTVFLGITSSVAFGDYITGANHVLPTGGTARAYSGLSTLDFVRWTSYQRLTPDAAARLAEPTAALARAEGLPGHAAAALGWRTEDRR